MKLSIRFSLFLLVLFPSIQLIAQTVNCNGYNPWVSTQTYNTETVVYNGVLYQSNWNNLNAVPSSNSGSGQSWTAAGTCAVPISYKTVSCTSYSSWASSSPYTGGTEVVYNNYLYKANNWTQGVQPDVNGDNSWHMEGQCQAASSLTVTGSLTAFTAFSGGLSTGQTITVTGSNLTGNVTVTAPSNFQVSLSASSGYSSSVVLIPSSGAISSTVYVFYNPSSVGSHSGNLTIVGGGATSQSVAVSGTAQATGVWLESGNTIYNSNSGNVGIGTSTPLTKLDVNGTAYFRNTMQVGSQRVLAGHTDYKFSVDGKITCQKLVATPNNWADTVFSEGYVPMKLEDIEQYVQSNKHLPLIPSEEEVKANGIEVGEMNTLLLQKVEELTLYVIELNKRIKQLEESKK